jgi:chromosome partitioning protein
MKGGVGKTTLTVNLASALARMHDRRVLLIDADPQFNASTYLMTGPQYLRHTSDPRKHTILEIFQPNRTRVSTVRGSRTQLRSPQVSLSSCTVRLFDGAGRLDLLPSPLELIEIEYSPRRTEDRLNHFIGRIGDAYDYVLIDCPPTVSIFTQAAILASQKYLVPVKPDPLSTIGLPLLERWLENFTQDAGITLEAIGIVFCMVRNPPPNQMASVMRQVRRERRDAVFSTVQSQSTRIAESVGHHQPIFVYRPRSTYAREILGITDEFLQRTTQ